MQFVSAIRRHSSTYILYFLLPFVVAVFPAVFHYANNSAIAPFSDLARLLAVFTGVVIILYILFGFVIRQYAVQTANAASVFLLFFHSYGLVFKGLRAWDVIRVYYFTFLP